MPRHPLTTPEALKATEGRLDDSPETIARLMAALGQFWIAIPLDDPIRRAAE